MFSGKICLKTKITLHELIKTQTQTQSFSKNLTSFSIKFSAGENQNLLAVLGL